MARIAIVNGRVLTMDEERRLLEPGTVLIEDQHIVAVGASGTVDVPESAEIIDASGMAVLPGFVNTHSHVPQILLRGGASHDRGLLDWLFNVLYPGLAVYTPEDIHCAALVYCAEAIRSGITTVVDNEDAGPNDFALVGKAAIDAFTETGIRGIYARMFFDVARPELDDLLASIMAKEPDVRHVAVEASLDHTLNGLDALIRQHHGSAEGRIQVWAAPSIPFMVSLDGIRASQQIARDHQTMWTMHVSEDEIEQRLHGMNTPEYLQQRGCLEPRLLAAHCVHIGERDVRFFRQHDVKVSTQPVSNSYLASGVAPVPTLISAGVTVGLGTDDANCNDSVNMLSDMKVLALLHRAVRRDASVITPEKILEMVTIDGARAVGLEREIGSLEVGKKSDMITIDLRTPQTTPSHDLSATLVFQAYGSEVNDVVIDGKIVMRNRELAFLKGKSERDLLDNAAQRSAADPPEGWDCRYPSMDDGRPMTRPLDYEAMLTVAYEEARTGRDEGGIPIGAAMFTSDGEMISSGQNRRVQDDDPSAHAETDAFRAAGRRATYADTILVTTLSPCLFCTGLVLQFQIPTVVIGDSTSGRTAHLRWLRDAGVQIVDLESQACIDLLQEWLVDHRALFSEDSGGR